ncbi:hypothetical protein GGX14DRAFT_544319, partial [Mycena pura]
MLAFFQFVPWDASPGTWGCNDAPGGSRGNGQFDVQPSTSTSSAPTRFPGPRRTQSYPYPTASHLPNVGFSYPGVMFPSAGASPAFGPMPHALSTGLPRREYAEPAPEFPALDQQLDFFSDRLSNSGMPDAPQEDALSAFLRSMLLSFTTETLLSLLVVNMPQNQDILNFPRAPSNAFNQLATWELEGQDLAIMTGHNIRTEYDLQRRNARLLFSVCHAGPRRGTRYRPAIGPEPYRVLFTIKSSILGGIPRFYPFTSDSSTGHYLKPPIFGLANSQIFWRSYQHLVIEVSHRSEPDFFALLYALYKHQNCVRWSIQSP